MARIGDDDPRPADMRWLVWGAARETRARIPCLGSCVLAGWRPGAYGVRERDGVRLGRPDAATALSLEWTPGAGMGRGRVVGWEAGPFGVGGVCGERVR